MFNLFSGKYIVNFDPFAVHFPQGFFLEGIRWYGLSYLAGFVAALLLFNLYSKKRISKLTADDNSSLICYMLFGVLLGGRLGYMLFYKFGELCANPLELFYVWHGGMASHGGFIGVILAAWLFAKSRKLPFLYIGDLVVSVASCGILFGRLANFINGELWGKVSDCPLAMIFPNSAPNLPYDQILARHPSQLYEAFLEGLVLFIYAQARFWCTKFRLGALSGEWLVLYGVFRIICEIFREPDRGITLIMGLSRGTFYSVFTIFAGLLFILYSRKNKRFIDYNESSIQ